MLGFCYILFHLETEIQDLNRFNALVDESLSMQQMRMLRVSVVGSEAVELEKPGASRSWGRSGVSAFAGVRTEASGSVRFRHVMGAAASAVEMTRCSVRGKKTSKERTGE